MAIKWSVERWLLVISTVVSVLAFTFGIGVNWARVTAAEAKQFAFEQAVPHTYVRADVYAADQRRLSESLDRLTGELTRLRERLDSPRPTTPPERMFDR